MKYGLTLTDCKLSVRNYLRRYFAEKTTEFTNNYYTAKEYYDMYRAKGGKMTFAQIYKSIKNKTARQKQNWDLPREV